MADLPERAVAGQAEAATPKPVKNQKEKKEKKPKEPKPQQGQKGGKSKKMEGAALIGIDVAKEDDLGEWYQQVLKKGEMLEFYDVSGCYILLPPAMHAWETIKQWFDTRIRTLDVRPAYFPIFIAEKNLVREKKHIEGFAAEVAWVTHGGKSQLDQRVAVRPTSETAMYPFYAQKIRSHRDLPLKLNQWNNVVRWEFKHPMPFIRSREFLWQEGHTAHLTREEAVKEVRQILEWYARIYEELLAVPVVKGQKTENEKFAGADFTETIEGYIPATGRGIQAGTSHCLGQNFGKMFDIKVEKPDVKEGDSEKHTYIWQNSWGLTTRSLGVMVLTHSDNKGLVFPPRVAEIQVVIVPVGVTAKTTDEARDSLYKQVEGIAELLRARDIRLKTDFREGYSPGWKFNDWELKGVPLRIEFGPKDAEKSVVTVSRRDQDGKDTIAITEIQEKVPALLDQIQADLLARARAAYDEHRKVITNWDDFVPSLNAKCVNVIPHCLGDDCEDQIKELSARKDEGDTVAEDARAPAMGAKSLCIPFDQPGEIAEGTKCLNPKCDKMAKKYVMFGRSY